MEATGLVSDTGGTEQLLGQLPLIQPSVPQVQGGCQGASGDVGSHQPCPVGVFHLKDTRV